MVSMPIRPQAFDHITIFLRWRTSAGPWFFSSSSPSRFMSTVKPSKSKSLTHWSVGASLGSASLVWGTHMILFKVVIDKVEILDPLVSRCELGLCLSGLGDAHDTI